MSQPDQEGRQAPSSVAPVQIDRANDDVDVAVMRGRRGARIAITVVVVAVVGIGGAWLLRSLDSQQAYALAAEQLERSDVEQRDAFMRCALPNQQSSQLGSATALQSAIEIATERMGKTYAKVLAKCTPLLDNFRTAVASVKSPADTAANVEAVSKAANDFAAAWIGLRDFIQSSGEFDRTQAAPRIQAITSTWESYQTERVKAKAALSAKQ